MNTIRIFLSSPGDVAQERRIAGRVVERLDAEFPNTRLDPYFWEYEPMLITKDYQEQIPPPSTFDIVICILWSRMGSRMHTKYERADGTPYRSGTEYEFVDAVEGQKRNDGTPDVLVWINKTQPLIPLEPEDAHLERLQQWRELKAFLEEWTRDEEEQTFKGAVNRYARLDEFEEKLERKLRKLILARVDGGAPGAGGGDAPEVTWTSGSPFRGLQAFDFEHAPVFFGRTGAVAECIEALRRQGNERGSSFLMVAGASGSGKSSLVRAGVLPMLVEPGVIEGIGLWRRATMRPGDGDDPFLGVAKALLAAEALPEIGSDGTTAAELATLLRDQPDQALGLGRGALSQAAALLHSEERHHLEEKITALRKEGRVEDAVSAERRLGKLAPPQARLVLLIDQFEEIFSDDIDGEVKTQFVRLVAALAGSGRVFVVATIRSDFFPRCADFPELLELTRGDGIVQLGPPVPAELGQMIRQPAQAAGLRFERDSASGETLDELLRDAAVDQPTVLPLLGFCLQELYEARGDDRQLTFAAYQELGGVEGAVSRRAEECFAALPDDAKKEFPRLVRAVVTLGGSDDDSSTRRRAGLATLIESAPAMALVESLVEARLFVADTDQDGQATVSVAHETLLRSWPRMSEAIAADRGFLRSRSRVSRAARRWSAEEENADLLLPAGVQLEEGREMLARRASELGELERRFIAQSSQVRERLEKRRIRRLQVIAAALGLLAIAAILAGFYASKQRNLAEQREKEAELRKLQTIELRDGADEFIGEMLYDLRNKLDAIDRPELLDPFSESVVGYFEKIPADLYGEGTARQYGTALNIRGDRLASAGDLTGALESYQASLEIARRRYAEDPAGNQRARDLSITLSKLAKLARAEGRHDDADTLLKEIATLPSDPGLQRSIADRVTLLVDRGDGLRDRGDAEGAMAMYAEAVELSEQLDFDPEQPGIMVNVIGAITRLGVAKRMAGELDEAKELGEVSVKLNETLVDRFVGELSYIESLITATNHFSNTLLLTGETDRAIELSDGVLEKSRELHQVKPGDVDTTINLLYAFNNAGKNRMNEADLTECAQLYSEGAEKARQLIADAPKLAVAKTMLAVLLNGLSYCQWQGADYEGVVRSCEEAIAALDKLESMDQFVALPYRIAYERLHSALTLQGKGEEELLPVKRGGLKMALRVRDAGLADNKLLYEIDLGSETLGEPWDKEAAAREAEEAMAQSDPMVDWQSYGYAFDRLVHARRALGETKEDLLPLHKKVLAKALEVKAAGKADAKIIDAVIKFLRAEIGEEEESPTEAPPSE